MFDTLSPVLPVNLDDVVYIDVIQHGQQVCSEDFNTIEDVAKVLDYYLRNGADYLSLVIAKETNPVILLDLSGENGPPASFPLYATWKRQAH